MRWFNVSSLFYSRVLESSPSPLSVSLLRTPKTCMHPHPQLQIQELLVEQLVQSWSETPRVASPWKTTYIPSYSTRTASSMSDCVPVRLIPTRDSLSWTAWMKTQWTPTWGNFLDCVLGYSGYRRAPQTRPKASRQSKMKSSLGCALVCSQRHRHKTHRWIRTKVRKWMKMKDPLTTWVSCSGSALENFQVQVKEFSTFPNPLYHSWSKWQPIDCLDLTFCCFIVNSVDVSFYSIIIFLTGSVLRIWF